MSSRVRLEPVKVVGRGFLALVVSLAAARSARADSPPPAVGDSGHVALSAERIFGFAHTSRTTTANGMDRPTVTTNGISILGNPLGGLLSSSYTAPRLAFDGFVAGGLSLGASVTYFHATQTQPTGTGASASESESSLSGLILAPRIGFAAHLSPTVSLWPRAGVTFLKVWSDTTVAGMSRGSSSGNLFAATIELPLAVTLTERAAFLIGPTIDIGLSGDTTNEPPPGMFATSSTVDNKETQIGAHAALLLLL
jgi:hypothetical protein